MARSLNAEQKRLARLLQCFVGALQWFTLFVALVAPLRWPRAALGLFMPFVLFAAVHGARTVYTGARTLRRLRTTRTEDAVALYERARRAGIALAWDDVVPAVVLPNYKEPVPLLRETIGAIAVQAEASRTLLVLAMEDSEPNAADKADELVREFGDRFADILVTVHPSGRPGEEPGKSANMSWAVRQLYKHVQKRCIAPERVVVTVADADAILPSDYLTHLTAHFAADPNRLRRFWQGHLSFFRNAYDVPPPTRVVELMLSTDHLAWLSSPERLAPLSTYSVSLALLHHIHYWDEDVMDEDFHIFTKACFFSREPVRVEPLFVPVQLTALQADWWLDTVVQRFRQAHRHAMGARTVGYILALQLSGPPFHLHVLFRVLLAHLILPATLLVTSVGVPWWHLWNNAHAIVSGDPMAELALRIVSYASAVSGVLFLAILTNFAVLKLTVTGRGPALGDAVAFATLPVAAVVYMYLPILYAQTTLFYTESVEYRVAPKPASTSSLSLAESSSLALATPAPPVPPNEKAAHLSASATLVRLV